MSTRVERTHAAVMAAATELLFEGGPSAVTIDGVVARSGVAKSTVYRHWATRDELVTDVFEHIAPKFEPPDPGLGFEDGLRSLVHRMVAMSAEPNWQHLLPALLLLKLHQQDIAAVEQRLHAEQLAVCTTVFRRGVEEGLIAPDEDEGLLVTLLIGPVLMSALMGTVALDAAFADRLVAHFLAAVRPVPAPR